MGYTTDFEGRFDLDKPLKPLQKLYLQTLSRSRRMKRNSELLQSMEDPLRVLVGLPVGIEGEFYIGSYVKDFPTWNFQNHHRFNKEFKKIALTLLCIQKYHYQSIGKDIFVTIISMLSGKELLDYDRPENIKLFEFHGEWQSETIINHNDPPSTQPGLWNSWTPSADSKGIEWDGMEKFYNYVKWLKYIIKNFLIPWGYTLDGTVNFQGEDRDDRGSIVVTDNIVSVHMEEVNSESSDDNSDDDENDGDE